MYLELLKKSIFNQLHEPSQIIKDGTASSGNVHSLIGYRRMDNVRYCMEQIVKQGIEGDFMECGVWRGGATIFMNGFVKYSGIERKVFVADSFQGLPAPSAQYPADKDMNLHNNTYLNVSLETVQEYFSRYDLLTDNVVFIKGFFEAVDFHEVEKLAMLRLDGDMYSSTINCLNKLYDKLVVGGYLLIDDYCIPACAKAVHDFRDARGISEPIMEVDWTGKYWQKTK